MYFIDIKNFCASKDIMKKVENLQARSNYLHIIYLIRDLYPDHIENYYNSIIKTNYPIFKKQSIWINFLRGRYTNHQYAIEKLLNFISHTNQICNAKQKTSEVLLHTHQNSYGRKKKILARVDKDVEKLEILIQLET